VHRAANAAAPALKGYGRFCGFFFSLTH